jgi:GGDEF domain-containing protein
MFAPRKIGAAGAALAFCLASGAVARADETLKIGVLGILSGPGASWGEALVRAVTEIRLESARYANPLTALPGNIPTNRQVTQLLDGEERFIACYGDLDHFKSYNDMYGYWRGDDMIQLCAEVINRHCNSRRDFVGHVGGDDFVMLLRSPDWRDRLEHLIAEFNERAVGLYDEDGRRHGGIEVMDRYGVPRFFPFVTLSVSALVVHPARCGEDARPQDIAAAVAALKRRVKQERGSLLVDDYDAAGSATA